MVCIGGKEEITIAQNGKVFGVISTNPGLLLNSTMPMSSSITLPVALFGKVPCRVVGKIRKGEKLGLHPSIPGVAAMGYEPTVGISLENKDEENEGLVMISTRGVI